MGKLNLKEKNPTMVPDPQPSGKKEHHEKSAKMAPVRMSIVTVSDTRTPETDMNGQFLMEQIKQAGYLVSSYHIVHDEPSEIEALLQELRGTDARIVIFNGGTGLSKRDTTYDVISRHFEKTMPGFGEIFRLLSYEQVGAAAMFSRATAGIYAGKVIISIPGSPAAVQLAWEKLIAPEAQHLAWEITR